MDERKRTTKYWVEYSIKNPDFLEQFIEDANDTIQRLRGENAELTERLQSAENEIPRLRKALRVIADMSGETKVWDIAAAALVPTDKE
jgi:predicted nuclease with TOPRIM domain